VYSYQKKPQAEDGFRCNIFGVQEHNYRTKQNATERDSKRQWQERKKLAG
jgi:hypothetical protein